MNPVFALVMGVLWLPLTFVLGRRLESESTSPEHREALARRVTGGSALVIPGAATLLLLLGSWFAVRAGDDRWWMWLAAGLLFLVNLVLALRLRRTVTGQWLGGGPREAGKRALAARLGGLAAVCYVGTYLTAWVTGPERAVWATVLMWTLLVAFMVLIVAWGFLVMFAQQDEAYEEWERDRGA